MSQPPTPLEHKLTAILYADVAGYSRLTEQDEEGTHRLLSENLDRMTRCIERHNGRVEHYAGDAILAEFASVTTAVSCALTVQSELAENQAHVPAEKRVMFRIGINLGEVIVDRGEIYGEGVNIAARLEALAEPGGVSISDAVRHEIRDKLPVELRDQGEHTVKNISEPIRVYSVYLKTGADLPPVEPPTPSRRHISRLEIALLGGIGGLFLLIALLWLGVVGNREPRDLQLPDKPSIAVLPFKNLNDERANEYFVDGITDDLITDLSKAPELFVISSNSSSRYKNAKIDVRDVARELGVRYILTGTLRKTPKTLRLNTQLTEARTGATLWADRYDADLEQIFDLQEVIVAQVIAAVSAGTSTQQELAKRSARTINIDAYDLFLQGWAHYNRESPNGYSDAIPLLKGALELDPAFYRPHAVLAAIYYQGSLRRWNQQWGLSNYDAVRKAYEHLQSSMVEPTALGLSVGALMHIHNGRHQAALRDARAAVTLDPNDPTAHIFLSYALSTAGEGEEALEYARRAMRLNPHYPALYAWTEGLAHFVAGTYQQAEESFEKAGTDHPGLDLVPMLATYGLLGKIRDARNVLEVQRSRWEQWYPGHPMTVRSMIAKFPPFSRSQDVDRLETGLRSALGSS